MKAGSSVVAPAAHALAAELAKKNSLRRPRTYRAAVLQAPGSAILETCKAAAPKPHEVRVRLEGCGVCGSNLPVWEGRPWFSYPREPGAPGHEGWGRIGAVGGEVDGLRVGDRVALLSYHAFAEMDLADAASVVALPPALDDQPFPGEALGCAMNVFRRAEIAAGQTVAVVGVGFLGALLVNLAAHAGARAIAVSRRATARAIATTMGAQQTFSLENPAQTASEIRALTGGHGCECVIEATGVQAPLDLATELTAERGRLVIAGYHQEGTRQVNMQLWNWRGLDVINAHERDPQVYVRGVREAVAAVASGRLDPRPLYTDRFRLDRIGSAFERLRAREGDFLKALVTYD